MDCAILAEKLDAYRMGMLSPAETAALESHLAHCPHCHIIAKRAVRLDNMLSETLPAIATMTPQEQRDLRDTVMRRIQKRRLPHVHLQRWQWGAAIALLLIAIFVSINLWGYINVQQVSAESIISEAQLAMNVRSEFDGVLHWVMSIEQRSPYKEVWGKTQLEVWFDFSNPARHRIVQRRSPDDRRNREFVYETVENGVDRMWRYTYDEDLYDPKTTEISLSPNEVDKRAETRVLQAPFMDDLARFAEVLPEIKVVGIERIARRKAFVLQADLFGAGVPNAQGLLTPVTSTVKLWIDTETYWLLGREETVGHESTPRVQYITKVFEMLPRHSVSPDTFVFTPPDGSTVIYHEGLRSVHEVNQPPSLAWSEVDQLPFTLYVPQHLPSGMALPSALMYDDNRYFGNQSDTCVWMALHDTNNRKMILTQMQQLHLPMLSARLVQIGEQQGWVTTELLTPHILTIWLLNWRYEGKAQPNALPEPGTIHLQTADYTLDEAIAILESLIPYTP